MRFNFAHGKVEYFRIEERIFCCVIYKNRFFSFAFVKNKKKQKIKCIKLNQVEYTVLNN